MKSKKLFFAALMFASAAFISSCKKDAIVRDTDTGGAQDNALAENTSNDVINIASRAADGDALGYRGSSPEELSSCAASVDINTVTKKVTVTFNGSSCLDGRTRSGVLVFDYSASTNGATHYRDPGFSCTVTSSSYVVDGNQISINNKTITNTTPVGFNPTVTNETWHITADITIVKASGGTVTWNCDRYKTLLNTSTVYPISDTTAGNNITPIDWAHARIGITGSAHGSRASGESYVVNVTSQLIRDFNCTPSGTSKHPFIGGSLDYTPTVNGKTKSTRHVDFGNGTDCDLTATVTIDGVTFTITLP